MVSTSEFVQPAMGNTRAIKRSAHGEKRSCIVDLRNLRPVLTPIQWRHGRLSPASTPSNICHRNSTPYGTKVLLWLFAPRQSISPLTLLQTHVTDVIDSKFSDTKMDRNPEVETLRHAARLTNLNAVVLPASDLHRDHHFTQCQKNK
jgi:hypothetical protein